MLRNDNPIIAALREVYGPLVKQSTKWPPVLAYGLPGIVAVLLVVLLRSTVPTNLVWLVGTVVLAPLIGYIVSLFFVRREANFDGRSYQRSGSIDYPGPDQIIGRTIACAGLALGIPPDMHLWLAVETGSLIWPKEGEVLADGNGKWKKTIFEDGATRRFSISLLIVNPKAHAQILEWLEVGRQQGQYAELKGIPGTDRIARVDKLRLKRSDVSP